MALLRNRDALELLTIVRSRDQQIQLTIIDGLLDMLAGLRLSTVFPHLLTGVYDYGFLPLQTLTCRKVSGLRNVVLWRTLSEQ